MSAELLTRRSLWYQQEHCIHTYRHTCNSLLIPYPSLPLTWATKPQTRSYISSCNCWPSFVSSHCIYPLELSPTWHSVICLLVYLLPASKDTSISSFLSWRAATINCFSRLRFRGLRNNICYFNHANNLWLTVIDIDNTKAIMVQPMHSSDVTKGYKNFWGSCKSQKKLLVSP